MFYSHLQSTGIRTVLRIGLYQTNVNQLDEIHEDEQPVGNIRSILQQILD